jgi:hypothetical protein
VCCRSFLAAWNTVTVAHTLHLCNNVVGARRGRDRARVIVIGQGDGQGEGDGNGEGDGDWSG